MKNLGIIAILSLGSSTCLVLQSCSKPPEVANELQGKLVLTGSSTVAPLVVEIAKGYEIEHPEARIDVQTGGSSRGIAAASPKVSAVAFNPG